MTLEEKKRILINEDSAKWVKTRKEQEDLLSDTQGWFCCCGRLATGLHEHNCSKFQHKVDTLTTRLLWEERGK